MDKEIRGLGEKRESIFKKIDSAKTPGALIKVMDEIAMMTEGKTGRKAEQLNELARTMKTGLERYNPDRVKATPRGPGPSVIKRVELPVEEFALKDFPAFMEGRFKNEPLRKSLPSRTMAFKKTKEGDIIETRKMIREPAALETYYHGTESVYPTPKKLKEMKRIERKQVPASTLAFSTGEEKIPRTLSFRKTRGGEVIATERLIVEPSAYKTIYTEKQQVETKPMPVFDEEKINRAAEDVLKRMAIETKEPPEKIARLLGRQTFKDEGGTTEISAIVVEEKSPKLKKQEEKIKELFEEELAQRLEAEEKGIEIEEKLKQEKQSLLDELGVERVIPEIKETKEKSSLVSEALESAESMPKIKESMEKTAQELIDESI